MGSEGLNAQTDCSSCAGVPSGLAVGFEAAAAAAAGAAAAVSMGVALTTGGGDSGEMAAGGGPVGAGLGAPCSAEPEDTSDETRCACAERMADAGGGDDEHDDGSDDDGVWNAGVTPGVSSGDSTSCGVGMGVVRTTEGVDAAEAADSGVVLEGVDDTEALLLPPLLLPLLLMLLLAALAPPGFPAAFIAATT